MLSIFFVVSCNTEETSDDLVNQQEESLSFAETQDALRRVALDFKATVEGLNGITLTESERFKLSKLADLILSDLNSNNQKSRDTRACPGSSVCTQSYNSCIWWAKSWDDLLRRCNGPVANRPPNCDQIRRDYIRNLDEIEATYMRCNNELNSCVEEYCGDPIIIEQ